MSPTEKAIAISGQAVVVIAIVATVAWAFLVERWDRNHATKDKRPWWVP